MEDRGDGPRAPGPERGGRAPEPERGDRASEPERGDCASLPGADAPAGFTGAVDAAAMPALPKDALSSVLATAEKLGRDGVAREVVASVLSGTLTAVQAPVATRDALPDTEPGSVAEALGVVAVLGQLRCTLAALDATWQVTAANRIRQADAARGVPVLEQGRAAAQELGLARRMSPASSSMSLAASRRLVTQLPTTFGLLAQGRVTDRQAKAIAVALDEVDADTARTIDQALTADPSRLGGIGTHRLRAEVRALRDALDPGDCRRRARRAARARNVQLRALEDHMVAVTATIRALDGTLVMNALRAEAEARRAQGSKDGARALEADALVDAVLGGDLASQHADEPLPDADEDLPDAEFERLPLPSGAATLDADGRLIMLTCGDATASPVPARYGTDRDDGMDCDTDTDTDTDTGCSPDRFRHRRITVGVVITDRALLAPDGAGELAHLEGYGPIPAHIITDTLCGTPPGYVRGSTWEEHPDAVTGAVMRRLFTHPTTGELVAMDTRSRTFPAPLAQMIRWRDSTCASPWCDARVRHIDHITPHSRGGPTSYANGQGLCARCNLRKDDPGWTVTATRTSDGAPAVTWASPGGATATCHLPPLGPRDTTEPRELDGIREASTHSPSVDQSLRNQSPPTPRSPGDNRAMPPPNRHRPRTPQPPTHGDGEPPRFLRREPHRNRSKGDDDCAEDPREKPPG